MLTNLSQAGYPAGTQSSLNVCVLPTQPSGSTPYPTIAVSCPLDAIQRVEIDLAISVRGSGANGTVENQTIVYRDPINQGVTTNYPYPYQYTYQAAG